MGYEIKMFVGKVSLRGKEWKLTDKRYDDDSGFEPERDDKGKIVYTDRTEHWFQVMAFVDLCKLGYQDDALNRLISDSFDTAKKHAKTDVHYFYGEDGNKKIVDDLYGAALWPVPVKDVLEAMKKSHGRSKYRRTDWAIALLVAMAKDTEQLEVIFYGH